MQLLPAAALTSPSPTFLRSAECRLCVPSRRRGLFNGRGLGHWQRCSSSARRLRRRLHTNGNRCSIVFSLGQLCRSKQHHAEKHATAAGLSAPNQTTPARLSTAPAPSSAGSWSPAARRAAPWALAVLSLATGPLCNFACMRGEQNDQPRHAAAMPPLAQAARSDRRANYRSTASPDTPVEGVEEVPIGVLHVPVPRPVGQLIGGHIARNLRTHVHRSHVHKCLTGSKLVQHVRHLRSKSTSSAFAPVWLV
jgi:hypothetical protein